MKTLNGLWMLSVIVMLGGLAYAENPAMPGMDPTMMEKMEKLSTPGEKHALLWPLAGKWNYSGQFWLTPESEPQEMMGTQTNEVIYGGRFLKQEIEGPWMGETFQGLGYTGYDNVKEEYVSVWLDSMMTGIMASSGYYDQAAKTLHLSGENSCPMTGEKNRKGRSEWVLNPENHTYTSYAYGPDGQEFKAMELVYTRAE